MFSVHKHIVAGSNFPWPAEQLCKCVDSSVSARSPLNIYKLKRSLSSYIVWLKYPETSWLQTRTSGGYRTAYSHLSFALAFSENISCFLMLSHITFLLPVLIVIACNSRFNLCYDLTGIINSSVYDRWSKIWKYSKVWFQAPELVSLTTLLPRFIV